MTVLRQFLKAKAGATAIEYGLIGSLLALAILGGFGAFADSLQGLWSDNNSRIVKVLDGP